jgi:hypothetical protein
VDPGEEPEALPLARVRRAGHEACSGGRVGEEPEALLLARVMRRAMRLLRWTVSEKKLRRFRSRGLGGRAVRLVRWTRGGGEEADASAHAG